MTSRESDHANRSQVSETAGVSSSRMDAGIWFFRNPRPSSSVAWKGSLAEPDAIELKQLEAPFMTPLRSTSASAATYKVRAISNGSVRAAVNGTNGNHVIPVREGAADSRAITIFAPQESRVRKILRLIESEPAHSIHDLAEMFHLSHSHLQHLFKQQTGVQLGHLLLEQRLLKAAYLLECSTMSVKEIAFAVGYEHASSFIRAFERRFGLAPRSYRLQTDRSK